MRLLLPIVLLGTAAFAQTNTGLGVKCETVAAAGGQSLYDKVLPRLARPEAAWAYGDLRPGTDLSRFWVQRRPARVRSTRTFRARRALPSPPQSPRSGACALTGD